MKQINFYVIDGVYFLKESDAIKYGEKKYQFLSKSYVRKETLLLPLKDEAAMFSKKYLISDSLKKLGFSMLSEECLNQNDWNILDQYVKIIEREAWKRNEELILEDLYFSGLIYG